MCGIAGIVGFDASSGELRSCLERMRAALAHRGLDDSGVFVDDENGMGFAHTRLSILDLSSAGHQPMQTADGDLTITFNGEIYNFQELRDRLEKEGVEFRSHTDTEVILRLFEKEGSECVKQFRGMFALGIWSHVEKKLFLARDPLGIKPLYYAEIPAKSGNGPPGMVFASELRAIVASGLVDTELSTEGLMGYFQMGSVPEPHTLLRKVCMLGAGQTLEWQRDKGASNRTYWTLPARTSMAPRATQRSVVRDALLDTVDRHFVSDVPVGVFLSGGIDSTALVALARELGRRHLKTYSIAFEDPRYDEGRLAARTARLFETDHSELLMTGDRARDLFTKYLTTIDQPTIDGFNTFCICSFARDQGIKVVLSGLGGDELFGGYPSFRKIPKMLRWSRRLEVFGDLSAIAGALIERKARARRWRKLGHFLQARHTLGSAYRAYRGIFTEREAGLLVKAYTSAVPVGSESRHLENEGGVGKGVSSEEEGADEFRDDDTLLEAIGDLEVTTYMRNQLLRDSDVMSMAFGLELRVPFVDRTLVEVLRSIPPRDRYREGKQLLIDAVGNLPEWVINRPKRGFRFPFDEWLGSEWKGLAEPENTPAGINVQTWDQKRALFILDECVKSLALVRDQSFTGRD